MLARLFVVIGGLAAIVLTMLLVAPFFIDWTDFRGRFEAEAGRIIGQGVTVRGAASARILPFPSVTFSDVVVNGPDGLPAVTIAGFSMDAELAPFLSGNILIFDMRIDKPELRLRMDASGGILWTLPETGMMEPGRVSLESVGVTGGKITLERPGKAPLVAEDVSARMSARSLSGPWLIEGAASLDSEIHDFRIAADASAGDGAARLRVSTKPRGGLYAADLDGRLTFEEGAPSWAGDAEIEIIVPRGEGGNVDTTNRLARINGVFTADAAGIRLREATLTAGPAGEPYRADGSAELTFDTPQRFAVTLKGQQLRFADLEGGGKAGRVGAGVPLAERLATLEAFLSRIPVPAMAGVIDVSLPALVAGDTTLRDLSFSAAPQDGRWRISRYGAELPGRTRLEGEGVLETSEGLGFRGTMTLASRQPTGFAQWLGIAADDGLRGLSGAGFTASVELGARRQILRDLELQLGEARYLGFIDRQTGGGAAPSIALNLDARDADLDVLATLAGGASALSGHDLDIALKAVPVKAGGLQAGGMDAALRVKNGRIDIDRLLITDFAGAGVATTGAVEGWPAAPQGLVEATVTAGDPAAALELLANRFPENTVLATSLHHVRVAGASAAGLAADLTLALAGGSSPRLTFKGKTDHFTFDASSETADFGHSGAVRGQISADGGEAMLALAGLPVLDLGQLGRMRATFDVVRAAGGKPTGSAIFEGDDAARLKLGFGEAGSANTFELSLADAEPFGLALGQPLLAGGAGLPLELKGDWKSSPEGLTLAGLAGRVAGASLSGDMTLMPGIRPKLGGALAVDGPDLAALLALGAQVFASKAAFGIDADLALSAASVPLGEWPPVTDASARFVLTADNARATGVKGRWAGGQVSGSFELARAAGAAALHGEGTATGADLAALWPGALSGEAALRFDLTSAGTDGDALVSGLSGSAVASVERLEVSGLTLANLPALVGEADAIEGAPDAVAVTALVEHHMRGGALPLGAASASFTVTSGVARAPLVRFQTQGGRLESEAALDLVDGSVDAAGSLMFAAADFAVPAADPAVNWRLSGPLRAATLTLDTSPMQNFLTQRALDREEKRVAALEVEMAEKQRLRRENRHYEQLIAVRRAEEEARIAAERKAAEEEERARRAAEEAANPPAQESTPIPPAAPADPVLEVFGARPLTP